MTLRRIDLIAARKAAKKTALDVAEAANIPEMAVYAIERGRTRPTLEVAAKWAACLGVKPENVFPELYSAEVSR